jgi:hypothetical protein
MTPQEQQMLQDLATRINQTKLTEKDPDAEQFIFQQLGRNSDSLYIMAQTILVQQYALDQAKKQLEDAKQQLSQQSQAIPQQPAKHGSFLGNLLGLNDQPTPPPPPQYQPQYAPVPNYPPQPSYAQPSYAAPSYASQPSQGGGFLRSAMTTATGVAAGALAFEGIESLMHGFGQHAGYGAGSGFGGFDGGGSREEIVNNYYGDSGSSLGERAEHSGISPDIEDRRDDSNNFADTSTDTDTDNTGATDDYGSDDSTSDMGSDDSSDYGSDDSN